jgi:hypothetical protein
MQWVFLPLFTKICDLVQAQIRKVESKYNQGIKVCLPRGLWSNECSGSFPCRRSWIKPLPCQLFEKSYQARHCCKATKCGVCSLDKISEVSHTAIMRGAVLYQLGLKVDERIMRCHYGVEMQRLFGKSDPERLKVLGNDGLEWCNGVMKWYVKKVS